MWYLRNIFVLIHSNRSWVLFFFLISPQLHCSFGKFWDLVCSFPVAKGKSTVLKVHFLCGGLKWSWFYPRKYQRDKNSAEPLKTKMKNWFLVAAWWRENNYDVSEPAKPLLPLQRCLLLQAPVVKEGDLREGGGAAPKTVPGTRASPSASPTAELRRRQNARTSYRGSVNGECGAQRCVLPTSGFCCFIPGCQAE